MRIHDSIPRLGINTQQTTQKGQSVRTQAADEAHAAEDVHVQLSARGRELSMKTDGEVDAARVDRLRASIASGEFNIDSQRIADRMLQGA